MRLQEIMSAQVIGIGPDEAADAAWLRMREQRIRHLLVLEGKRLLGVLSERDLGGRHGAGLRAGRRVRELMTASPATAAPNATLRQAANLMRGRLIGSLPVVEQGRVVGIVTATDVLDELGRGASRPEVRAQRRSWRRPPAGVRKHMAEEAIRGKRPGTAARKTRPGTRQR